MMVLGFVLSVGDALTTMAANSTTFPEIFTLEQGRRRLSYHQRALAGTRASDHVAMLYAFQVHYTFITPISYTFLPSVDFPECWFWIFLALHSQWWWSELARYSIFNVNTLSIPQFAIVEPELTTSSSLRSIESRYVIYMPRVNPAATRFWLSRLTTRLPASLDFILHKTLLFIVLGDRIHARRRCRATMVWMEGHSANHDASHPRGQETA